MLHALLGGFCPVFRCVRPGFDSIFMVFDPFFIDFPMVSHRFSSISLWLAQARDFLQAKLQLTKGFETMVRELGNAELNKLSNKLAMAGLNL